MQSAIRSSPIIRPAKGIFMSRQSRREFLENSMFATLAAASAGSLATSSSARADGEGSNSPNEKLRVAVLGVRGRGKAHINGFMNRKDCDVVAIVDPDEHFGMTNGVEAVKKATGHAPAYHKDLRKVMDDDSIDIVSIATPNHWHALAAIWGVQHGKHVYVEKPVSHNVSEGRRIVQAARKHGKLVQTGTQVRSSTGVQEAIQYVHSGGIGEVKLARGLCYNRRGPIGKKGTYDRPTTLDYDLWAGPAPLAPLTRPKLHYDWHWVWDTGNGDLGNQGIHQMDLCRWGLGLNQLADDVVSYGGRLGYTDAGESANTQVNIFNFGDRKLVFEVRGLPTEKLLGAGVGAIFYGSEGYVVIDSYTTAGAFDPNGKLVKHFKGGGDHFGNFVEAVHKGSRDHLHAEIEEGHLSSALCHLGNISYRLGKTVALQEAQESLQGNAEDVETFNRFSSHISSNSVDLSTTPLYMGQKLTLDGKQEIFTGEMVDKANAMLTREYRAPFVVPTEADV